VASVHSGLDMDEPTATKRICHALDNPYTTMLGHATGRLLLARRGFPLDWVRVIETAARCGVAIELNANPRRLDVDWRHLRELFAAGIATSINPDAHVTDGILDMHHGVAVARKAGTTPAQVINCMEATDLARYFQEQLT
jgi:DNA polymerase (family 10)